MNTITKEAYERQHLKYCGIDVSKHKLVCALIGELEQLTQRSFLPGQAQDVGLVAGEERPVIRSFTNSWEQLLLLVQWLRQHGVELVVMESTNSYWHAVYAAIDEAAGLQAVLANPRQVKNVAASHKTDLKDCVWLAVLLRAGFVRPSYVPCGLHKELREATRARKAATRESTAVKNRLHRLLDTILLQLGVSDAFGKQGKQCLQQALAGEYQGLSEAQRRAFERITPVQRHILADLFATCEFHRERIQTYDALISQLVQQLEEEEDDQDVRLLATVPGLAFTGAAQVKGELGTIERFPSGKHLSSYAGCVPRTSQSGLSEHRQGTIVRQSNKHLRTTLFIAAWVCARSGPLPLRQFHQRIKAKRGAAVATIALARRLLVIIWWMLHEQVPFARACQAELTPRKQRQFQRDLQRLTKLAKTYGNEALFGMLQTIQKKQKEEGVS